MKIEIVGTGCPKCKALENNTKMALNKLGQEAEIIKVDKLEDIISKGKPIKILKESDFFMLIEDFTEQNNWVDA